MFERFTERARQVVVLAQDEARILRHNYIGTEHILLGLLREEEGLAARTLERMDITVEEARAQIARIVGVGDELKTGQIPFTPEGKKVLERSLREALSLGHQYIGTEHILLGLVRVDEGVGAGVLRDFGADAETIRNEIVRMLSGPPSERQLGEEIARVRRKAEEALERQEYERAASLRARERSLLEAAHALTTSGEGGLVLGSTGSVESVVRAMPDVTRGHSRRGPHHRSWQVDDALLAGWLMFGVAGGLGVLLAWLIWG